MADQRAWLHLYKTKRWRERRTQQLTLQPLCEFCLAAGHVTPATVADHKIPHKGDEDLFWNGALQSLCKLCHDSAKQTLEMTGHLPGCGADGWPLDPNSHWNR